MEWVPEGWIGSAHIFTDDNVVAIADRYKAGTDMWITNTASNKTAEADLQVPGGPSNAPYVLLRPGHPPGLQRLEHRYLGCQHGRHWTTRSTSSTSATTAMPRRPRPHGWPRTA